MELLLKKYPDVKLLNWENEINNYEKFKYKIREI